MTPKHKLKYVTVACGDCPTTRVINTERLAKSLRKNGCWVCRPCSAIRRRRHFVSYEEAKATVKQRGIRTQKEYQKCKDSDLPSHPQQAYKEQWRGWGEYLGTGRVANQNKRQALYLPFKQAREIVRSQGFHSKEELTAWKNRPVTVPATPNRVYEKSGWRGYGDWLGTGRIANQQKQFLSLRTARKLVQAKNFKGQLEFQSWKERPDNIPGSPSKFYRGWKGWADFLGYRGKKIPRHERKSIQIVRDWAVKHQVKNEREYRQLYAQQKLPYGFPSNPQDHYGTLGTWRGWSWFLGRKVFTGYELRSLIRKYRLCSWALYRKFQKHHPDLPSAYTIVVGFRKFGWQWHWDRHFGFRKEKTWK